MLDRGGIALLQGIVRVVAEAMDLGLQGAVTAATCAASSSRLLVAMAWRICSMSCIKNRRLCRLSSRQAGASG